MTTYPMKKIALIFITALLTLFELHAQEIRGTITDTSSQQNLEHASIVVLHAKDSTLQQFTRTKKNGNFALPIRDTGNFILLVSYPNYADHVEKFRIESLSNTKNLGNIDMISKVDLLQDVVVKSSIAAIRIKGDTTEFVADSFRTMPNASVEDLLKKFPGIQVDRNGKITAQGETVSKVLVDGEEFFGDDPTLVTKNLKADMVDKVQLFDKKSDEATFTGIDDGVRTKTLNVKLKADKKKGYFGKIEGGYGTNKFYQNEAMFNYFKNKRKISGYLTHANTGKTGLGFNDANKLGINSSNMSFDDGITIISDEGDNLFDTWSGQYRGEGIPTILSGGVHYDNKWNEDKQNINLNAKSGKATLTNSEESIRQTNFNNGSAQINQSQSNAFKNLERHKADGIYEIQLDSTFSIKATFIGSQGRNQANDEMNANTKDIDGTLINSSIRRTQSNNLNTSLLGSLLFRKQFKKKGRTITMSVNQNYSKNDGNATINSNIQFVKLSTHQVLDQYRTNVSSTNNVSGKIIYTEPISQFSTLGFTYGYDWIDGLSNKFTYGKDTQNNYSQLDSAYSSNFSVTQNLQRGGISFNYNKNNFVIKIGTDVGANRFEQIEHMRNLQRSRQFINWFPTAYFKYNKGNKRTSFSYNGRTVQPSINQLQPIRTTEDTLSIYIGNPNLTTSFSHSIMMGYQSFYILSGTYLGVWGSANLSNNPIVTNVTTDFNSGRNVYSYFNSSKANANGSLGIYYRSKIKNWNMNYGFHTYSNVNRYVNSINNIINTNDNYSFSFAPNLSYEKEKMVEIGLESSITYNFLRTTNPTAKNNDGFSFTVEPIATIILPQKWELKTNLEYLWRQKTQAFNTNFERIIWNASVSKKFLKKENLQLKLSALDILNQNKGFSRSNYNNTFSQSSYTTIARYFMLSLIWDFNQMGSMTTE